MARAKHNLTLSNDSTIYLKQFDNMSKIVDEALELHKNKDIKIRIKAREVLVN